MLNSVPSDPIQTYNIYRTMDKKKHEAQFTSISRELVKAVNHECRLFI